MSIRELTWQIKQVVLEAQNFTSILPSLQIFRLKTYEISDLDNIKKHSHLGGKCLNQLDSAEMLTIFIKIKHLHV